MEVGAGAAITGADTAIAEMPHDNATYAAPGTI